MEGLLVPSLRYGLFTELKEELLSVGGTVDKWENYLAKSCQYFEAKHLYAILYKVQLFMKVWYDTRYQSDLWSMLSMFDLNYCRIMSELL